MYRGGLPEAIAHLQSELSIDPNFSMAWYRLGDAYARQQNCDLAIPNLQRAVWGVGTSTSISASHTSLRRQGVRSALPIAHLRGRTCVPSCSPRLPGALIEDRPRHDGANPPSGRPRHPK